MSANEQTWVNYVVGMLLFHVGGFLILYVLHARAAWLPFNPAGQSAVAPDLSFNTAISFITNTNWQNYGGESTLSYLVQMLGLTTKLPVGGDRHRAGDRADPWLRSALGQTVGNFWVDITRCTLYILLPICDVGRDVPGLAGHPADARPLRRRHTLDGAKQTIAVGPVASQIAIKTLGTNGGGLFNANCGASVREPDCVVELRAHDLDLRDRAGPDLRVRPHGRQPAPGLGHLRRDGRLVPRRRHHLLRGRGQQTLTTMSRLCSANFNRRQHGGQGGPLRHRRLRPVRGHHHRGLLRRRQLLVLLLLHLAIGGMIPLINIQLGEIIIGGVGAGLYGMLLYVIIAIFVAGRMARACTLEYVGKKIEAKEVKMAMLSFDGLYHPGTSTSACQLSIFHGLIPRVMYTLIQGWR